MYSPQDVQRKEKDNNLPLHEVNYVEDVCAESLLPF